MASPDTDELATVPLPTGDPQDRQAPGRAADGQQEGAPVAGRDEVPVVRQERAELGAGGAAPRGTEQVPSPTARQGSPVAGSDVAEASAELPEQAETARQEPVEAEHPSDLKAAEAPTVEHERVAPKRIEAPEADAPTQADTPTEVAKERGRWWRGLTGSLAAGLAVLAVGVLVVGVVCLFTGAPGPGAASLIGHPVAAVLALAGQRVADRRRGLAAVGGGVAVVLFAVSAATVFWFS